MPLYPIQWSSPIGSGKRFCNCATFKIKFNLAVAPCSLMVLSYDNLGPIVGWSSLTKLHIGSEFLQCNWLIAFFPRRTKKRKVFVVSTQKRPVPLEHYLYTGNSTKTSNELFMIVDAQKSFKTEG